MPSLINVPRSAYAAIADRLQQEAERNAEVSTYLTAEDVADALGDEGFDPDADPYEDLRKWVRDRRLIGAEPTADDILRWCFDQTRYTDTS